jgi:hypothetical protein
MEGDRGSLDVARSRLLRQEESNDTLPQDQYTTATLQQYGDGSPLPSSVSQMTSSTGVDK